MSATWSPFFFTAVPYNVQYSKFFQDNIIYLSKKTEQYYVILLSAILYQS